MQARRLVVRLADGDDRGEVAVLPVLQVRCRPVRPLHLCDDVAVLDREVFDPAGSRGLDAVQRLVLVVHHHVHAMPGDLRLHESQALLIHVEFALLAGDVSQGQNPDDLRDPLDLHLAPFQGNDLHLLRVSFPGQSPKTAVNAVRTALDAVLRGSPVK